MIPIPQDDATRQQMLDEIQASVEDFRGVPGFSVLRTERPGSAIGAHAGIQDDVRLERVLTRMRMQPTGAFGGKLIIVCTKLEQEWRIARLSGIRTQMAEGQLVVRVPKVPPRSMRVAIRTGR